MDINSEDIRKGEMASSILSLSTEGNPLFPERVNSIVEESIKTGRPIAFATIACRTAKLSGQRGDRLSTPDIIWAKERNDQPVEISLEATKDNGLSLVNQKLAFLFIELPQLVKKISCLGIPFKFGLVVGDDPSKDTRRSLSKIFKHEDSLAFEVMSELHLKSVRRIFMLGLENAGITKAEGLVRITAFSQEEVEFMGEWRSFVDTMAFLSNKIINGDGSLPANIFEEKDQAIDFFLKIEPEKKPEEMEEKVLTNFIPERALAGILLSQMARRGNCVGPIILSAPPAEEPLHKTQSVFLSGVEVPVLFPFKTPNEKSTLDQLRPEGILVNNGSNWFSVAMALTLDLLRWLDQESNGLLPKRREIADKFMPVILGERESSI